MNTLQNKSSGIPGGRRRSLKRTMLVRYKLVLCMVLLILAIGNQKIFGQGVGISESAPITPHTSSILELQSTTKGFLAPRMSTAQRTSLGTPAPGLLVYDTDTKSFWYWDSGWKAFASEAWGTSNQLLGMNNAGNANEYKTLQGTADRISVTFTPNLITLSTPQDIATTSSPTFAGLTLTSPLTVPNGGTGLTSGISGGIPYFNTSTSMASSALLTANGVVIGGGAGTAPLTITVGATNTVLRGTGAAPSFGQIQNGDITNATIDLTTKVTGILPLKNGGTNTDLSGSSAVGDLLTGTATGFARLADIALGNVLISGGIGVAPSWGKVGLTSHVSGVLPVANGGTNSGAALSGSSIIVSDGTSIVQGPKGTNTTVLHGNAAGVPSYSAVDLTLDVTNVLPVANGGTGSNSQNWVDLTTNQTVNGIKTWENLGIFNAGITASGGVISLNNNSNFATSINTGSSTANVTIGGAGNSLYLPKFITAGVLHNDATGLVTSGPISLTTDLSGILPVPNGGTGVATLNNHGVVIGQGTNPVAVTATGTAGQVLQSGGASADPLYSAAIYPSTTTANQILYSSTNDNITGLTTGNNGVLITSGTGVPSISSTLPGAVQDNITRLGTITSGVWNGSILGLAYGGTNTDLSAGGAIGDILYANAPATFARLADIALGNVLISGGIGVAPSWGKVGLTSHVSGVLPVANGGTNSGAALSGSSIMVSDGTSIVQGPKGTNTTVLHGNASGVPSYSAVDLTLDVTNVLPVANGGTGSNSQNWVDLTTNQTVNGIKTWENLGIFNAGITATGGVISLNNNSNFATSINTGSSTANVTIGGAGNSLYLPKFITAGVLHNDATGLVTSGPISLTTDLSGILPVPNGGTGVATLNNHGVVIGQGTNPVAVTATGTAGQVLQSGGASADPLYSSAIYPSTTTANQILYSSSNDNITGLATGNNGVLITSGTGVPSISSTLPNAVQDNITRLGTITSGVWNGSILGIVYGGTNSGAALSGSSIIVSDGTSIVQGPKGTNTTVLHGNASGVPSYSAVDLTLDVTNVLPVANGGTGSNSQNWVDLTTNQTVNGIKTWENLGIFNAGITASGGVISLNNNSNFATNINTGSSTSNVTIGGAGNSLYLPKFITAGVLHNDATGLVTSGPISLTTDLSGILPVPNGGTGVATLNNHGVVIGQGTNPVAVTATGTAGQVLQSGGASADPLYSAAIYPSTTTANQILYSSSNDNITGLTTGNNGVLITSGTGVPSISSTLPGAVQDNITRLGTITSGVWNGSILGIVYGGTNSGAALSGSSIMVSDGTSIVQGPKGTNTTVLHGNASGVPSYSAVDLTLDVTNVLPVANGGTGSNSQNWVDLTTNQTVNGIKTWENLGIFNAGITATGGVISLNNNSNFATNINTGSSTSNVTIGGAGNSLYLPKFTTAGVIHNLAATGELTSGLVINSDLGADAVTTDKIKDGEVQTGDIADANVTNIKLADNSVTTSKILNANVTVAKLGTSGLVDASKVYTTDASGVPTLLPISIFTSSYLLNGQIFIGDASNIAVGHTMSGDATLNNTGVLTISNDAVNTSEIVNGAVTSAKIADGTIVNADIAAAAAIDATKLIDGSVTNTELGYINTLTGNAQTQIDSKANISGQVFTGAISATNLSGTNTGDVTLAGQNYLSILNQVITANAVDLSGTNATGTLAAARFPSLSGDVTTTAGSLATTISANAVTYGKMQAVSTTSKLLGSSSTTTAVQEITLGSGLTLSGNTLTSDGLGGTVTSVGLSLPSFITVTNSPVTGSGVLTGTLASQLANTVFAAPNGSAGAPAFRSLVAADIPSLDWSKITTGLPTTLAGYGITDAALSTHNHTIDGLSNVTITGKANNDILQWNGSAWVNKTLSGAGIITSETDPIVKAINGIVKSNGTVISAAIAGTDYVAPNAAITAGTNTKITYDTKGLVTVGASAILASADYAGQGTATAVLHGGGAGNPSWSQIVNADIDAAAGIVDTKLATISTAGKVSNSATTATSSNTINTIVLRDGSGNFSAGTITASLSGNATSATSATSATTATTATNLAGGSPGTIPYQSGAGATAMSAVGSAGQVLTSNGAAAPTWSTPTTGTVTSVGLSLPSFITVTNSPVTGSGTLTGTLASQAANTFFAAPNGSAGAPSFRSIVAADIPNIAESQVTNLTTDLSNRVLTSTTVNGHALSSNVVISASDITTGTLPHAQLPALVSGDIPNNGANTTGNAATATTATTATNAINTAITNDVATASSVYPTWVTANTGNLPQTVSSTKLSFVPSTGILTATGFAGSLTGNATTATTATNLAGGSLGTIPYQSGAGATTMSAVGTAGQVLTSNGAAAPTWTTPTTGTVTSVGLSLPAFITVTNSPVTGSGTLTGTLASQSANMVFAAPNGSAGAPAFRSLVAADIPNIAESQVTNLTTDLSNRALTSTTVNGHALSSNVVISASDITTGTLPHAQLPALVSGDIPNNGANTTGNAATATTATNAINTAITNDIATASSVYPTWVTANTGNLPQTVSSTRLSFVPSTGILTATGFAGSLTGNATTATTATNLAGGSLGTIPYQSGAGATTMSAVGTAGQVLTSNGAAAPTWTTPTTGTVTSVSVVSANGFSGTVATATSTPAITLATTLTQGSVPFIGASGALSQDNANLYWDNTNKRLGIGAGTNPTATLEVQGDVNITATGSTTAAPREIGITNWANGNAARYTFGDDGNAWQNAYGDRMQLNAYWGIEIFGNTGSASAPTFIGGTATDPALNVIGTRPAANVLTLTSAASQTANIQEWRNSAGTALASVNSAGVFVSNIATGVAPFTVASTTPVTNLSIGGNAATATSLATTRSIYGNNFNGTADLTQIIASTYGGTGNGFTKFSGPAGTEKTFTLPNANATILTNNAAVTVAQGGTGLTSGTQGGIPYFNSTTTMASSGLLTQYGVMIGGGSGAAPSTTAAGAANTLLHGNGSAVPTFSAVSLAADVSGTLPVGNGGTGAATLTDHGVMIGSGTSAVSVTATGSTGQILQSNGASADPSWSTATYPATAGNAGGILVSDGSNNFTSGALLTQGMAMNANVTMTFAGTFYTGPSITLSPGTWFIMGTITLYNTSAAQASATVRLWDGLTAYVSSESYFRSNNNLTSVTLSDVVQIAASTTFYIQATSTQTGGFIRSTVVNNGATLANTASFINAVRIGN
jgi:hypothetical protein